MPDTGEGGYKLHVLGRSVVAISTVVFVEVILGLAVRSLAIISDGLHAMLDVVTTLVLFIATGAPLKPRLLRYLKRVYRRSNNQGFLVLWNVNKPLFHDAT
jgi:hypothetical protein